MYHTTYTPVAMWAESKVLSSLLRQNCALYASLTSAHTSNIANDVHCWDHVGYIVPHFVHILLTFQFCFVFCMEEGHSTVAKRVKWQHFMGGNTLFCCGCDCNCNLSFTILISILQFIWWISVCMIVISNFYITS